MKYNETIGRYNNSYYVQGYGCVVKELTEVSSLEMLARRDHTHPCCLGMDSH